MASKRLTAVTVENLRPRPQRYEVPDGGNGLYAIVQPSGAKSWAVRYRYEGKSIKMTLGTWPAMTLPSARKAAADALHELAQDRNPASVRFEAKEKAAAALADTVRTISEEYLGREGKKLRTVDQRASILKRLVYPNIGDRPVESLKRNEINRLLDKIEDRNGPRAADMTLAVLSKIFNWHAARSDEFNSPIVRGMARHNNKEHRRTRILDDTELRAVWTAALTPEMRPFGDLVRFLLLTAARRGEAAGMRTSEVDANHVWTLPAARSKNKSEVIRPLGKAAQAVIAEPKKGDFVFSHNAGITPITNFSKTKQKLDRASGVTRWRLHDLRRTARSLLSRAGIHPDLAERCLGHAIGGVRGVYDRHQYVEEMRRAFEALAALIARLVSADEATGPPKPQP